MSFREVRVNHNVDKMHMDYYLKLDDKPSSKKAEHVWKRQLNECSPNCITHDIHVVSTKTQRVWISLNTWRKATMPDGCLDESEPARFHSIYPTPEDTDAYLYAGRGGSVQLGPFAMKAGQF